MRTGNGRGDRIKVVLRYDDYSALSDFAIETAVLDVLRRHGLRSVFGVIPFAVPAGSYELQDGVPLDGERAQALREAVDEGLVEAALHGCRHLYLPRFYYARGFTEFEGLSYSEQSELIAMGKAELERVCGCKPRCFIPPFNSYDEYTVQALKENGIECLSAAVFDPVPDQAKLLLLPHTCNLSQLRDAVELARKGFSARSIVTALFHAFDFSEFGRERACISMSQFESLAIWLASQQDVEVMTVSQVVDSGADLSPDRYQANRKLRTISMHPLIPASDYTRRTRTYYPDTAESRSLTRGVLLKSFEVYVVAMMAGLASGGALTFISGMSGNEIAMAFAVCSVVWFSYLFWRRSVVYCNAAMMSIYLVSSVVGGLMS